MQKNNSRIAEAVFKPAKLKLFTLICFGIFSLVVMPGKKVKAQGEPIIVVGDRIQSNSFSDAIIEFPFNGFFIGGTYVHPTYNWLPAYQGGQVTNAFNYDNLTKQVHILSSNSGMKCSAPKIKVKADGSKTIECHAVFGEAGVPNRSGTFFDLAESKLDVNFSSSGGYTMSIGSTEAQLKLTITPDFKNVQNITINYDSGGDKLILSFDPVNKSGTLTFGANNTTVALTGSMGNGVNRVEFSHLFVTPYPGVASVEIKGNLIFSDKGLDGFGALVDVKY
jgi:hypothetical protein